MRHIKYRAELLPSKREVRVQILEQTHLGRKDFGTFVHKGFTLASNKCPENSVLYEQVWLRGWADERHNDSIIMPLEKYRKFKEAVIAYNEFYK